VFRRTKSEDSPSSQPSGRSAPARSGPSSAEATREGKGRPTPTRREAEAARRARAKKPRSRRDRSKAQRAARTTSSKEIRAGLKAGDERYLPKRDRGPVRRFVRDYVDARFSFGEIVIPLMLVTLVLGYSGNPDLAAMGNSILMGTLLVVVLDMVILRFRLKRELGRRFPGEAQRGATYYAMVRVLQMRFMRLPRAQVKINQPLPDTYR